MLKIRMLSLTACLMWITGIAVAGSFDIVQNGKSVPVVADPKDAAVVGIAGKTLAGDIELITGIRPELLSYSSEKTPKAVIIGTLGHSILIKTLADTGKIDRERLDGKWETFLLQVVKEPFPGVDEALVIAGSDPRGTAFGVFELSKRLGVSPWVYWADVAPARQESLSISLDRVVMGPPSVKYRGIFLNDEDWGLKPWAAKNIDTDIKDIGPKTYARIFELMLRLKANFIWPAMHACTKAFFYYEDNPKVAAQYDIVVGASHCEPMLRNNVDEWKVNFEQEYGRKPGPWRYDTNREEIHRYWDDRVKEAADGSLDAVFTVGMRGIHDSGMPGAETIEEKVKLLDKVIQDQREILSRHLGRPAADIPQIFCPYKEVLQLYQEGVRLPDDVTIVWADDNHGYIRQLSTPEEQQRSGRSGVYHHLSYWGKPMDYLWLSSISPALISHEMSKAYAYGADRLWVFNVGDIKPAELETEFAMDLAWNVEMWPPEKASSYVQEWAERTFGKEVAAEIASIQNEYYRLAAAGKPEHVDKVAYSVGETTLSNYANLSKIPSPPREPERIDKVAFSTNEIKQRLTAYQDIARRAEVLKDQIPEHLQDAYYQLILYPVSGAARMNEKHLYARMGNGKRAVEAYDEIQRLTEVYNKEISGGKWDGMMDWRPRERKVFDMPEINTSKTGDAPQDEPLAVVSVNELQLNSKDLHIIPGLGIDGRSLSRIDVAGASVSPDDLKSAPQASIELKLPAGHRRVLVMCVPAHAIHEGRALRTAISLGDSTPVIVDVDAPAYADAWVQSVLCGYSVAEAEFDLETDGTCTLRFGLMDPGLAISRIAVY